MIAAVALRSYTIEVEKTHPKHFMVTISLTVLDDFDPSSRVMKVRFARES